MRMDEASMPRVTARILNILAALVWYIGGIILLLKGSSLLAEAAALKPGQIWPWLAMGAALLFGSLEGRYRFSKSCRKNLDRIANLEQPRIWQFYGPLFFVLLALMIATGATLSRLAHGKYAFLIGVAALDLGLAIALLASSNVYWKQKAFTKKEKVDNGYETMEHSAGNAD